MYAHDKWPQVPSTSASTLHNTVDVSTQISRAILPTRTFFVHRISCLRPWAPACRPLSPTGVPCLTTSSPVATLSSTSYHMNSLKRSVGGGCRVAAHKMASKEGRVAGSAGAALALLWMIRKILSKKNHDSEVCSGSLSLSCTPLLGKGAVRRL